MNASARNLIWVFAVGLTPVLPTRTTAAEPCAQQLLTLAKQGNANGVRALLRTACDPNVTDKSKVTPLIFAVERGDPEIVGVLLGAGANPNAAGVGLVGTPLMIAARGGREEIVLALLSGKADPNRSREADGMTALHLATAHDHLSVARALIAAGAQVDARLKNGLTPLLLAARRGFAATLSALVVAGADVRARDDAGWIALPLAASERKEEAVRALLRAGADPNQRGYQGQTALIWTAQLGMSNLLQPLIDAGACPDLGDTFGITPLMAAAQQGNVSMVRALLSAGADTSPTFGLGPYAGTTALMAATLDGHADVVKILLDAGSRTDARRLDGFTAYLLAATEGHAEILRGLAAAGADVNAHLPDGTDAIALARKHSRRTAELAIDSIRRESPTVRRSTPSWTPSHDLSAAKARCQAAAAQHAADLQDARRRELLRLGREFETTLFQWEEARKQATAGPRKAENLQREKELSESVGAVNRDLRTLIGEWVRGPDGRPLGAAQIELLATSRFWMKPDAQISIRTN